MKQGSRGRGRPPGQAQSHRKILDAAASVFSRSGFHKAKMEDISAQAGVAKGTLYYNFKSKSRLFSAMVTDGMETIISTVRRELELDLRFPSHFRKLIEVNIDLHQRYSDLFKISFNKPSPGIEPRVIRKINEVRERYVSFIEELLVDGMTRGYLKKIDPHLAAVAILGLLDSLSDYYEKTQNPLPREQLIDNIYTLMSSGLVNPQYPRPEAGTGGQAGPAA
jgi:AcrR family transcriptional regulator